MTSENQFDIRFAQRFSANVISNVLYFIINIVIGLLLVPFFIDSLGESTYGLIPLATSITSYVLIFIDAANGSVSRFLTLDLQRADVDKSNETFNTSLFGLSGIVIASIPIVLIVSWFLPNIFNIGEESTFSVFILFSLTILSALVRIISGNFMVTLFAYNRLDLRNYINIISIISQVLIVIFLFAVTSPSLEAVGISYFVSSLIALLASIIFSKLTCSTIIFSPHYFRKTRFKEIMNMTVWVAFGQFGYLLRTQFALIAVNIILGTVAGTSYSLVITWINLLLGVAALVTNTFTPMIYSYRAKNDMVGMKDFVSFATKMTGIVMALPLCLICLYSSQLYTLWVGEQFAHLSVIVWIAVLPVIFKMQASCIVPIYQAHLLIKVPMIVSIIVGILTIILTVILPGLFENGLIGVAIASSIAMLLYEGLFTPLYNAYVVKANLWTFIKPMSYGILGVVIILLIGIIVDTLLPVIKWGWVLNSIIISIVYLAVLLFILLNKNEKILLRSCLPQFVTKIIPSWIL
ncbi:MAG: lipopolysaccharide biosynthesis protein [Methanocorpusculum sp.]|nr:lipopolysaccharide biosynthesis protein [Methanocorpusculum sp.]